MKKLVDLSNEEALKHFLKGSSYSNVDFPPYISFEPILTDVSKVLGGKNYYDFVATSPMDLPKVNYDFIANKDGQFAWRPLELIHPVIYSSLVNTICDNDNWSFIKNRLSEFDDGIVDCCSAPVMSLDEQRDVAKQISSWWQKVEQRSLAYSLEYSHVLHTDVADCYGSLYTHSISWALHGIKEAKRRKDDKALLGNIIDTHIRAGRYGQTNGISQGSVLMDFVAEIVLGYVDKQINTELSVNDGYRILRYRDDYRIFANSDEKAEEILKIISDKLRVVGMKLSVSKTNLQRNVIKGSLKPDKLAGIELKELGAGNAKTVQKQLLRLHSFGQRFPNSGALRRLVGEFHDTIIESTEKPDDLDVLIAIATDIGFVSPATFPAIAGILSHLIFLADKGDKVDLWTKVIDKMNRVPHNGYLEIWLQRVTQNNEVGLRYNSNESICKIVNGETSELWENNWISSKKLKEALNVSNILIGEVSEIGAVIQPEEIELFKKNIWNSY